MALLPQMEILRENNSDEVSYLRMVLFNDWSARDIQKWEYVPLDHFWQRILPLQFPWIAMPDVRAI
jgi:2-keto-4-pentenoate hydratase/2-oxohepta-3-ene-1,7-dioic acid hydratase in catechol pathway